MPSPDSDSTPDSHATTSRNKFSDWAQLVRLPNVFTVLADVSAAYLLVGHHPQPIARFVLVVLAGVALYWAGMILNDVFDVERDQLERPSRPIPAGLIPIGQARMAGWGLLILGVALAAGSGQVTTDGADVAATWMPAAVALALAVMVVAYDGPLKKTPLAPAAMGSCRILSFLLGASPWFPLEGWPYFPKYLMGIAIGFGVYIMGITTMARHEASTEELNSTSSPNLSTGLIVTGVGAGMLAFAPQLAKGVMNWHLPREAFALIIGMIAFPVMVRALRAVADPVPLKIQTTIRIGILSLIPFAAAFAFLGAGPLWGTLVFALSFPAILLAIRFRVT